MANYTNEKLAWEALTNMFGGSKPTPNPALERINLPAPTQPDYSGGWLGSMLGMSGPTPNATTKGMLADRAAGTDTASRHAAMRQAMPANLPATPPPQPDYSGGWLGSMLGMSGPTPNATTKGMLADRAAGTDTASRRNAQMQAGTNVGGGTPTGVGQAAGTNAGGGTPSGVADTWTAPNAGDWLPKGNQSAQQPAMGSKLPKPGVQNPAPSTAGSLRNHPAFKRPGLRNNPMFKDDFDEMAADNTKAQQLRNATGGVGNGTHQGTFSQGKLQPGATFKPANGVKQSMDKQATFHANRLHILNTELAKHTPAALLKQAADYPTARNKQACAYYLGLKKQAAVEKKAFLKALLAGLKGGYGLLSSGARAAAPHVGAAARAASTGAKNFTVANPGKALVGAGGLTLAGEHYGLPFLGDVANTVKDRYNESAKGFDEFMHRIGRGYSATTADPTSDFTSDGINKAKKVIESITPKSINSAVTSPGIIPSKPSRYLRVEESSIPNEFRSRSLPEDAAQWRSGTRGRSY